MNLQLSNLTKKNKISPMEPELIWPNMAYVVYTRSLFLFSWCKQLCHHTDTDASNDATIMPKFYTQATHQNEMSSYWLLAIFPLANSRNDTVIPILAKMSQHRHYSAINEGDLSIIVHIAHTWKSDEQLSIDSLFCFSLHQQLCCDNDASNTTMMSIPWC